MNSLPQPFLLPIRKHQFFFSKTWNEIQPQHWSYHQIQLGGHGWGWTKMHAVVRARTEKQPDNGPGGHLTTLAHTAHPTSSWPQLCGSTLQLQPGAQAANPPPRGWVLGQGPTSFTGPLSSLSFVFGEFNPSSPTSLRVLMTSHCCCDHLFSLTFSSIPQC